MSRHPSTNYWRSLEELQQTPEFRQLVEREFPVAAADFPEGVSRRRWMQLMGASLALGGFAGCRWQEETIAPFAVRPNQRIPGEPEQFATTIEWADMARHLLVTCYDGRPIKVEGNPQHPSSLGSSDVFAQASLLGLYDPDRSGELKQRVSGRRYSRSWDDFSRFVRERLREPGASGRGIALLCEPSSSVAFRRELDALRQRYPDLRSYAYTPLSRETEKEAMRRIYGRAVRPRFDLGKARIIATFGEDLLGHHPNSLAHAQGFAAGRDPAHMNRLYAIESQYSLTGAAADHRLAVRTQEIGQRLVRLEELVRTRLQQETRDVASSTGAASRTDRFLQALADDLLQHRGEALVVVGRHLSPQFHIIANDLNNLLSNYGSTLYLTEDATSIADTGSIEELVAAIKNQEVDTLLILGGNPAFDAPSDLQFSEVVNAVPVKIRLGLYEDETSAVCDWHLPQAHAFESWDVLRSYEGIISLAQPLIEPLLNGKSAIEVLALISGDRRTAMEIARHSLFDCLGQPDDPRAWNRVLHDGFVEDTTFATVSPRVAEEGHRQRIALKLTAPSGGVELVFVSSESVFDGRFANNAWLQETPGFLTKLTWDNAAIFSPQTAKRLGVEQGSMVKIQTDGAEVEVPAFVLPGQADDSITIGLGYGRREAGIVGGSQSLDVPQVGFDVYPLRTTRALEVVDNVTVSLTSRKYPFATTQDHHAIDTAGLAETQRRVGELVRSANLSEYEQHPDFAQHVTHHPPLESLWSDPVDHEGPAWGMSIDLNKCIGCNACVVACQAENNVPVVGKDQVGRGREMHWIRVDRYFQGDVESPRVVTQPVACHHCENAPCEQVCPVAATVHSDEGLNDMIYNRCVGTRYCANNCPYKVRRFNFFDYNEQLEEPNRQLAQLVINPEVTVRSRGVMEKCTYCVQRIQSVKIDAKNENRPIRDGEIKTACQQACPTRAIEFGDIRDQGSRVAAAHADPRAYGMLSELNVQPRTKYLARLRNPHPSLEVAIPVTDQLHG